MKSTEKTMANIATATKKTIKETIEKPRKIYLGLEDFIMIKNDYPLIFKKICNGCKPSYIPKKINLNSKFKPACQKHDYLYWISYKTRKDCDKIFLSEMKKLKTRWFDVFQIYSFYYLVRVFGNVTYSESKKDILDFLKLS